MVLPPWNSYLAEANLWQRSEQPGPPPFVRLTCMQPECSKVIDFSGLRVFSTGNLLHHYRHNHKAIPTTEVEAQAMAPAFSSSPPCNTNFGQGINLEFNDQRYCQLLVNFVVKTNSSLYIVNRKEFQELVQFLNPYVFIFIYLNLFNKKY